MGPPPKVFVKGRLPAASLNEALGQRVLEIIGGDRGIIAVNRSGDRVTVDLDINRLLPYIPHYDPPFWARVTGATYSTGDNAIRYAWTESVEDPSSTTGGFMDLSGGRTGTTTKDTLFNSVGPYPIPFGQDVLVFPDGQDQATPPNNLYHTTYGARGATFRVALTQDGGSAGSDGTACTYTYAIATRDGTALTSGNAVEKPRPLPVQMTAATIGWAYVGNDGTLVLADVGEVMADTVCA